MWVFCCGMNRSGSTLQYQLAAALVEEAGRGRRAGGVWRQTFAEACEKHRAHDGYLVAKTHDCFPQAFDLVSNRRAKAISIHRDIRDVAVSYMSVTKYSFWSMIGRGFLERATQNDTKWGSARNVLVSSYDRVKSDVREEVRRIAAFLDLEVDAAVIDKVASDHCLEQSLARQKEQAARNADERYHPENYDAQTLLLPNHITHGGSGRWEQELSSWQIALIEHITGPWMKRKGYPLSQPAAKRLFVGLATAPARAAARVAADGLRWLLSFRRSRTVTEETAQMGKGSVNDATRESKDSARKKKCGSVAA